MRRPPVSYQPSEPGWWLATDGLWYPPELAPGAGLQTAIATGARSKVVAGLLALFLGTLGVHRFYLGQSRIGVTMLLISVLSFGLLAPAVAIWALVECVLIFTGGIRDAQGRPLV